VQVAQAESTALPDLVHARSFTAIPAGFSLECTDQGDAFAILYAGRQSAYGLRDAGASRTVREPVTPDLYRRHLVDPDPMGWSLGIIPIREDDRCMFGVIDFDLSDHTDEMALAIVQRSAFANLPLVWSLSKSRGLHGALFLASPQPAAEVRRLLDHWTTTHFDWKPKGPNSNKADGIGSFEIFPKQDAVERAKTGNFIHLAWSGGDESPRYGFNAARRLTFAEWLAHAWSWRATAEEFAAYLQAVPSRVAPVIPPAASYRKTRPHTLAEARALLRDLAAERWDDYGSIGAGGWLDIGMVLHAEFEGADDALVLWDEFSRGSERYDPMACEEKWKGFAGAGTRRQAFGSLVTWAQADRAHVTEDALADAVEMFNQRWALVLSGGNAILETPTRGDPQFHEFHRWKRFVSNTKIEVPGPRGMKVMALVEAWLGAPNRRSYHGIVFDPDLAAHTGVPAKYGDDGDLDFNLWPGLALTPSAEGSCDLFLDHLLTIICQGNDELCHWLVMWLAHIVQQPSKLAGTAVAVRGPQGTGKTVVGDVMGRVLGPQLYSKVSKPEELTGRFNSHHQGRLLLQVEEGFWAGDHRAEGALKHMITSDEILVEPKFVDPFTIRNFMRLLITSNHDWVVPAGFGERRFAVLDVSEMQKDNRAYHGAMRKQMFQEGGCARFLHHLLHEVQVDEGVLWRPPVTAALAEQKLGTLGDHDEWLLDILMQGELPGDVSGTGVTPTGTLFAHYLETRRDLNRRRRSSETVIGVYLRRNSPLGLYGVTREKVNGRRCYVFPTLAECRARFAAKFGHEIDWMDGTEAWIKSIDGIA
jgi:Family of unknown function (DUF5906)/Primase C terminal 2 (PriCT-2)